ncbi:hypothetical protein CEXT_757101, partial [Caerostris extrusa]
AVRCIWPSCFERLGGFSRHVCARPADVGGSLIRVLKSLGAGESNVIDKERG